jgi:hypothetical protein
MSEKMKRKTTIRMVGNNLSGMRRIVAVVQDEGLVEAKRYCMGIEAALRRREPVVEAVGIVYPGQVADVGKAKVGAGAYADELSVPLAGY